MKLYSNGFAPSPRRVRMFAAEKHIPLSIVDVDLAARAHHEPGFREINARGEVPVLELDDGRRLTESLAICRYLEAVHPEPNLWGRTADERYAVDSTVDWLMFSLYAPTVQAFRHGHAYWSGRIEQCAAYVPFARGYAVAEQARLDAALAGREYLCLDRFTMADIVAFTTLEFGKVAGLRPLPEHTQLLRWRDTLATRPSTQS